MTFPTASKENAFFFTQPLLPKHRLAQSTLGDYTMNFAVAPLTNGCATLSPQKKDLDSLIFDLSACDRTNFAYYQIKSYRNFEEMDANLQ